MTDPTKAEEALAQIEERLVDAEIRMEKSVEALHKELSHPHRAGQPFAGGAAAGRGLRGAHTAETLAGISTPEARLLVIRPYDRSSIPAIEKAIQRSDLGLTPSNDGQLIRIVIPQLTEERRHELTKLCARRAEEARVAVRNIRRDEVDHLRKVEKDGHLSRDDLERSLGQVQHITDQFISKLDDVVKKKEAEILEV